jgi:dienelactone hydrolase
MVAMRNALLMAALTTACACGQGRPLPPFVLPDDIASRKVDIMSEGVRLSGEVFSAKALAGKKLPTIVMSHGWGGTVAGLRRDAAEFAKAGYLVVAFDYRGWGLSDSRVILTGRAPADPANHRFTAEVQEVREVVDPMDMSADILNALHWVQGEPQADVARIGLWGSSFSGGLVVYAAEHDPRVKAVHSQVPSLDGRWIVATDADRKATYDESTKRARGEIGYPEPRAKTIGNLIGAPIRSRFVSYYPVEEIEKARQCAIQFVIAEKEELFDNKDHAIAAYNRFKGPKNLVTIPKITHYGVYGEARVETHRLAQEWFDKYLTSR